MNEKNEIGVPIISEEVKKKFVAIFLRACAYEGCGADDGWPA